MIPEPHFDRWTFGSSPATNLQLVELVALGRSSDELSESDAEESPSLEDEDESSSCSLCSSAQSGCDGSWTCPDLVRSGCSAPILICLSTSSKALRGADSTSREYVSNDPFCVLW